ncbi:MAG: peptide chain release factor N(5)-glutamine methyltransferase [Verrucomicrobiales bacterium]|nr:peptide chain release factor N(5)-glutamine methyltransferase [Verrucomicrobiales bacterium]
MTTILDTLQKGEAYLERHGVAEGRLNMQHLLAFALQCDRMQLYLDFDRPMSEEVLQVLRDLVKRRAEGVPVQHLVGSVEFSDHEFSCDERGLVPRPETEELLELLLAKDWQEGVRILDMGTGSGVIGLTLSAKLGERLGAQVTLVDFSDDALALAGENRERLGIDEKSVSLLQSDLFDAVSGEYDLIVANLPYISQADMQKLSREVQCDPSLALLGGVQGTELMERFLQQCRTYMKPEAMVAMEFGYQQANVLRDRAVEAGLQQVEIVSDDSGHERFLFAREVDEKSSV